MKTIRKWDWAYAIKWIILVGGFIAFEGWFIWRIMQALMS